MSDFHLTRRAARDLRDIHRRSAKNWGLAQADRYLSDIYGLFAKIAAQPEIGRPRARRSAPFLMMAVGQHFIVYDNIGDRVAILTVIHQVRDVEQFIRSMSTEFLAEIGALRDAKGQEPT